MADGRRVNWCGSVCGNHRVPIASCCTRGFFRSGWLHRLRDGDEDRCAVLAWVVAPDASHPSERCLGRLGRDIAVLETTQRHPDSAAVGPGGCAAPLLQLLLLLLCDTDLSHSYIPRCPSVGAGLGRCRQLRPRFLPRPLAGQRYVATRAHRFACSPALRQELHRHCIRNGGGEFAWSRESAFIDMPAPPALDGGESICTAPIRVG